MRHKVYYPELELDESGIPAAVFPALLACMGVKLLVNSLDPLLGRMGVNLRRGNVLMAEHLLDRPYIRPLVHHFRGEGVPESVRSDRFNQAGSQGAPPNDPQHAIISDPHTAVVHEQGAGGLVELQ